MIHGDIGNFEQLARLTAQLLLGARLVHNDVPLLVSLLPGMLQLGTRGLQVSFRVAQLGRRCLQTGLRFIEQLLQLLESFFLATGLLFHRLDLFEFLNDFFTLDLYLPRDLLVVLLSNVNAVFLASGQQITPQALNFFGVLLHVNSNKFR